MIAREGVKSPAIIVVGEVVTRSDAVDVLNNLAVIASRAKQSSDVPKLDCFAALAMTNEEEKVKLLTGNDLASGDVVWWTGQGWSQRRA